MGLTMNLPEARWEDFDADGRSAAANGEGAGSRRNRHRDRVWADQASSICAHLERLRNARVVEIHRRPAELGEA
jgi:hypothetical protein